MRNALTIPIIAALLLMGCGRVPSGYTRDSWSLLKERRPQLANSIEWATATEERRAVRQIICESFVENPEQLKSWDYLIASDEAVAQLADMCRENNLDMKAAAIMMYSSSTGQKHQQVLEKLKKL